MQGITMKILSRRRQPHPASDSGQYRVQLYSRRAVLIREFSLEADRHGLASMEAAEEHLRQTLQARDSSSVTVALIDESPGSGSYLQFDIDPD